MAPSPLPPCNIILFGPPGSGKTVVGRELAERLKRDWVDADSLIETRAGRGISQIFSEMGEKTFRKMEADLVRELSAQAGLVISCGGGMLLHSDNREVMEASGKVIFLDCDQERMRRRLKDSQDRPLLAGEPEKRLQQLLKAREEAYRSFSFRIDTSRLNPPQVVEQIMARLSQEKPAEFALNQPPVEYSVLMADGLLKQASQWMSERGLAPTPVMVSDSNVASLYGRRLRSYFDAELIVLPAGEKHKNLASVRNLYRRFLEAGLDRQGIVVALGGGVVGDTAGFAAATYMRGVKWVNMPTTLLAMLDASVGGKVGVDLPWGKNLVGSFHPPSAVISDTDTLATLPESEFRSGLAELVKAALIGDRLLFSWLERDGCRPTARWIERALAVKISLVEQDPYERDVRAKLNLGHTVAHGIEAAGGYRIRHGEAVALGLIAESRAAEAIGLADPGLSERIEKVLGRLGLPARIGGLTVEAIRKYMHRDKKRAQGRLLFTLPRRPGEVETGRQIPESVVNQVLESMLEEA